MARKIPLPSHEEFYNLYIIKDLSIQQLKDYYKVGRSTIDTWIRKLNILKRENGRKYLLPSKEDFFQQYHTNNLSITELCEYYKVPEHIIRRWAEHFNFSKTSKEIGEIRAKAFYKKHGVYNPSQLAEVKEKRRETMLSTYGVDNIFKDTERIKKAYINKLGVNNPSQLKEVKKKKEQTFLEHFGVSTSLQLPNVRQRQIEVTKEKYGENGVLGNEAIKAKIKQSVQEKYGVDNVMQLQESKDKRIDTNKEKYGHEYYSQTEEGKNRIKETCLAKYGKDNYFKTEEFANKKLKAIIDKYGVDSYSKTQEFKDFFKENYEMIEQKKKKTNIDKFGVDSYFKTKKHKQFIKEYMKKYHIEIQKKIYESKKKHNTFNKSKGEEQVYIELLKKYNKEDIIRQYKSEEYPFVCDFYIKSIALYIECHFSHFHNFKPFDINNAEHIKELKILQNKAKEINFKGEHKKQYEMIIKVWTITDPKKLQTFIANKLNFKIFYTLTDFLEWFRKQ